jgi:hypothetical protein
MLAPPILSSEEEKRSCTWGSLLKKILPRGKRSRAARRSG